MRDYSKTGGRKGFPGYRTPSSFQMRVLSVVRDIPKGKTLSYGDVAKRAGSPNAYRAVGSILNKNKGVGVPCHRVIRSDGSVGCYFKGRKEKERILKEEGVL